MRFFKSLLAAITVLIGVQAAIGQQSSVMAQEKKAVIQEIMTVTGLSKFSLKQKVTASSFGAMTAKWVASQTGLTEQQIVELKRIAAESA